MTCAKIINDYFQQHKVQIKFLQFKNIKLKDNNFTERKNNEYNIMKRVI